MLKQRIQTLWMPGLVAAILTLAVSIAVGRVASTLFAGPHMAMFVYGGWLLILTGIGAFAAYWSRRAGGSIANRTAAAGEGKLPVGSILIKENFDSTGTKLMAVTVMYRVERFAPDAGDWHWAKYEADGTVSAMKGMRLTGKVGMCIECHRSAGGGDFVFANDR